jgi:2-methylfumaryl-CoA isomerase
MLAVGLLAAERHRHRSGNGQHVKLALADVGLAIMQHLGFIGEAQLGQPRERHGNDLFGAFGRDFPCANGERIMVVGLTSKQWRSICECMGIGADVDALGEKLGLQLSREGDRFKARRELAALVGGWIAARPVAEVALELERHGVCWSRYQDIAKLVSNDPECSVTNPLFANIDQAGVGSLLTAGLPLSFPAAHMAPTGGAPQLGQHTEEVLSQILHIDSAQYGKLHDSGIAGQKA